MILTKDIGYTRAEVLGERRVSRTVTPPSELERALAGLAGRSWRLTVAVGVAVGVGLALAYGPLTAAYAGILMSAVYWWLSDLDPEPVEAVTVEETPGMTSREVWEAITLHDEDEQVKEDVTERETRRAKREAKG